MSKTQKWGYDDIPDLTNKTIIVTGANSGIGFEATKVFANYGAHVIMACRSLERGEEAKQIIESENKNVSLDLKELDLSSFASIETFSDTIVNKYASIHVLLNNAGIMTVPYGSTEDGIEKQFGVNHLGHYYLTMKLIKTIDNTPDSRIVNVSSIAHKYGKLDTSTLTYHPSKKYNKIKAYSQSKLANLLFTNELADRLLEAGSKVKVLAAHPGVSSTNLGRHTTLINNKLISKILNLFQQTQKQGALPLIRACTDFSATSKDYYGPSGFYEMKGHPVKVKQKPKARNQNLKDRLWEVSVKLTRQTLRL